MTDKQLAVKFEQTIDRIEQALNEFVDSGSDHELFLSGYLHGHFSLIVSQSQLAADTSLAGLDARMQNSLGGAFENGELEAGDQQAVLAMWQRLIAI